MNDKELVAHEALKYIKNNSIVGLGTGSTANFFIDALALKIKKESLDIKVVASSTVSQIKAIECGLNYISLDQIETIDTYVDGADEVTKNLEVLKGRGYDLNREKLLAQASNQFIVIGDKSKIVNKIGEKFPIPIEITPIAWKITKNLIKKIAINCVLRPNTAGDAFAITSDGNYVLDCKFEYKNLKNLSEDIAKIPGVIECGIFQNIANIALIAENNQITKITLTV
jgi:ribose 5-phosphate isomerase A